MKQPLAAFVLFLAATVAPVQVGDRSDLDRSGPRASWKIPASPLMSPEASLRGFDLPPGFALEIVAAEPLVQDPIAMAFDESGRAWVLEWPGYNWPARAKLPGLADSPAPRSRVVILEDTDGDGRMDRRSVFLDGLDWARGVQPSRDGAFVLALPRLLFARDRDGDGIADHEETIVDGLEIAANPWLAQADVLRTLDNWITGSRFTRRVRGVPGAWRIAPQVSRRGQWGLSQDNFGRLLYASNGDHLVADLVPGHYFTRNPHYAPTAGIDVRLTTDQRTWPHAITPGVNRRAQLDEDGRLREFTANTGPLVYRGDQFGPEFVGNVFLGEAAGHFVRRSVLRETDAGVTAANAYNGREFLFSPDERFRPVAAANGPDGALYLVDMHRGIIEGYLFQTSFLRDQFLDRKLHEPFNGLGRIYRLVRTDRPRRPAPVVARETPGAWVPLLAHPNGFWRDTAQRLLVERGEHAVVPALREMALRHSDELARLHALWTLEGLAVITPDLVTRALADPSPRLREAALRIAEPYLAAAAVHRAVAVLAADPAPSVRRQLLFSLGELRGPDSLQLLATVLVSDADRPGFVEAAISSLTARELALLDRLRSDRAWSEERPGRGRLLAALAQSIAHAARAGELKLLLDHVSDAATHAWMRLALLDGLAGAKPASVPPVALLEPLERSTVEAICQRAGALRRLWSAPAQSTRPAASARKTGGSAFVRGETLFAFCAACHGANAAGQSGVAPPLDGSKVVAESTDAVVRSILFGRNLDRRNPAFPDMPPFHGLPDDDVAAIATYVGSRWGNRPRPVAAEMVRALREGGAESASAK